MSGHLNRIRSRVYAWCSTRSTTSKMRWRKTQSCCCDAQCKYFIVTQQFPSCGKERIRKNESQSQWLCRRSNQIEHCFISLLSYFFQFSLFVCCFFFLLSIQFNGILFCAIKFPNGINSIRMSLSRLYSHTRWEYEQKRGDYNSFE